KGGDSMFDKRVAIVRRPYALPAAVEEGEAKCLLCVGNGPRDRGLRDRKLLGSLRHAARIRYCEQDFQLTKLELASDVTNLRHRSACYITLSYSNIRTWHFTFIQVALASCADATGILTSAMSHPCKLIR